MCILFIHINPNPKEGDYRLIAASNRDEYYERPATPVSKIDNTIIGGKYFYYLLNYSKNASIYLPSTCPCLI